MQPQTKTATQSATPTTKFDRFSIFLIAKNAQNSYGIKTGDYMRYRRYCSRKINKLRKAIDYKYGSRTKFVKKDISIDKSQDKRILQIIMFSCQKYWAYANQSKFNDTVKQTNKLRAKFMAVKKFKRAYQWSQKLIKICKAKTDHITISQAQAYSYYLNGLLYLEQQDWKQAQTSLIACRQIISDLLGNIDTMNAKVYRERIDQVDQTIKFCNFKISKGQQIPIQQIIQMRKNGEQSLSNLIGTFAQRKLNQLTLNSTNQIKFGSQRYPIKDQKILQSKQKIDLLLQNTQKIKKKVFNQIHDEQLFQQLLNFFSTVITTIDSTIKMVDIHKQNVKQYTQGQIAIYKKISLLFQEIKYNVMIDRNNIIIKYSYVSTDRDSKKNAPQNLAKLLSNTMGIYSQNIELQKLKNQGNQGIDPQIIRTIDSKIFYYRTLRLYFVGQVYYNNQKIKQAYSLWQECQRCLQSIKNSQQQSIKSQLNLISLTQISINLKQNKLKCIIKNYKTNQLTKQKLNNQMEDINLYQNKNKQQDDQFTLYQLMDGQVNKINKLTLAQYSELKAVELPGKILPIPTRPIFYDIFQSTIQYPTLDNKVQKGWFGKLFKR